MVTQARVLNLSCKDSRTSTARRLSLLKTRFGVHRSSPRGRLQPVDGAGWPLKAGVITLNVESERQDMFSTLRRVPKRFGYGPSVSASGVSLCGASFVAVVQATNLRNGDDAAIGGPRHLARDGRIFVEGKMSPRSQVVGYESYEVATQTAFR